MRAVICWAGISGYMAACWRALAAREGMDLLVLAFESGGANTAFDAGLVRGINCRLLNETEKTDAGLIASVVSSHRPDAVSVPGWLHPPYTALTNHAALANTRFVMGMDTPWQGTWRQRLARFRLRRLIDRMDCVIVAGERSWQYARRLGVPERKIRRGVYGHDHDAFAAAGARRANPWPRKFLCVARYVESKGIDILLEGYQRYRQSVSEPWTLTCCGQGPLGRSIQGEGVNDIGFVQPNEMPNVLEEHGAFVLASRYEPWGVAIAEAGSSGLPIICSEACGASVELVRSYFNGITVATGDAGAVSNAMRWTHEHTDRLPPMGERSKNLAAAFSAQAWAERWQRALSGDRE